MDHFKEEVVTRQQKGLFNLMLVLITLAMAAAAVFTAVFFMRIQGTMFKAGFNWGYLILFLVCGAALVGLFWIRVNIRVEYEYSFTNGDLDVDKVVNNSKRKPLASIEMKNIEKMAPVEDESYAQYDAIPNLKRIYAVLNRHRQIYFLVYGEEEKTMLLFEPSREMVDTMRLYNASRITVAPETEE